jgi:hypothetical protein
MNARPLVIIPVSMPLQEFGKLHHYFITILSLDRIKYEYLESKSYEKLVKYILCIFISVSNFINL